MEDALENYPLTIHHRPVFDAVLSGLGMQGSGE